MAGVRHACKIRPFGHRLRISIEPPRSTIGIAAVRTAIEYEYRFTEYRFAEYEYDEVRCEARTIN